MKNALAAEKTVDNRSIRFCDIVCRSLVEK